MKKVVSFYLAIALIAIQAAVIVYLLRTKDFSSNEGSSIAENESLVSVIQKLGYPENQCILPGLRDENSDIAFGLQWGVDWDSESMPGSIYEAERTIWFNIHAKVRELE